MSVVQVSGDSMPELNQHPGFVRLLPYLVLAVLIFVLDLLSKQWFSTHFVYGESRPVTGFFNLVLVHNYGAAFSFLSNAGGWQRWFFVVLSSAISIWILVWLYRAQTESPLLKAGLSLVLGGAVGNLWDRLIQGYVVDFIDIYYQSYHWPAFNVADSAITIGALLIFWDSFAKATDKKGAAKKEVISD